MKLQLLAGLLCLSGFAHAAKLTDYTPFKFEVLFTNPVCAEHRYDTPELANDGTTLVSKPVNVYCKSSDIPSAVSRSISPQYRLLEWIAAPTTKELFLAYLSFSNKDVSQGLCNAAKRGVKISFVLDAKPEDEASGIRMAEDLKKCGDVKILYRGNRGGIGYAHNKVMMVNPDSKDTFQMVYSSGNLSTGTSINHENWNFITTSPATNFAGAHRCLREGLTNHADTRKDFTDFMTQCRAAIGKPEEEDIRAFFVPCDGKAALAAVTDWGNRSTKVDATAHRFSGNLLRLFTSLLGAGKSLRLITDDDMYWTWKTHKPVGMNMVVEAYKVFDLKKAGLPMRFVETNQNERILQHNKYMIFDADQGAVFNGAGNFTSDAFDKNFENFYLVQIPEVVAAFRAQYVKFWSMATPEEKLPRDMILP